MAPRPADGSGPDPVTESAAVHLLQEHTAPVPNAIVDLARRAAAGDRDALEQLLLEVQEVAWRFSKTVCGHTEDAEDAMQEALVQTFRFIARLRDPDAFRPWLYRMVRNACLMSRRRRVGEPRHLASLDELLPTPGGGRRLDAAEPAKNPEQLVVNAALRRRLPQHRRRASAQRRPCARADAHPTTPWRHTSTAPSRGPALDSQRAVTLCA
jgi:RNA polymerase sigma factor (sigma-70 family)